MKLYTGCWWVGCYIGYSEGPGRGRSPPSPSSLYQMWQSTLQLPVYQSPYWRIKGSLLYSFNVLIKGLNVRNSVTCSTWYCPSSSQNEIFVLRVIIFVFNIFLCLNFRLVSVYSFLNFHLSLSLRIRYFVVFARFLFLFSLTEMTLRCRLSKTDVSGEKKTSQTWNVPDVLKRCQTGDWNSNSNKRGAFIGVTGKPPPLA